MKSGCSFNYILFDPYLLHPVPDFFFPVVLHLMELVRNVWKIGMRNFIQPVEYCLEVWPLMTIEPPAICVTEIRMKIFATNSVTYLP